MTVTNSDATRIAYQPALDGVRALAVVAVLLFHAGTPGFGGGYLGVSVFFTLSGFLITSLLVHEHGRRGSIALRAFYSRRLRRLLPASLVTVAAVVVASATTDWFAGVSGLRQQVLGSVFQVANWVSLAGDGSYQELLAASSGTPSPLEHFWSLAIEEQFYWCWPLVMTFVLAKVASPRSRTVVLAAITAVFAVAAPVIAALWGADAAYWATPARLSEILVGAFLAVALASRRVPGRAGWLAPPALLLLGVAVVVFPAAGGPAYRGALPLVAVVSGALLVGLQAPGPVRRVLSTRPFVEIGRVSYGLYLFHWPVYVVLDGDRVGIDGVGLTVVRLAVTAAVTVVSFVAIEQPIRHWNSLGFGRVAASGLVATGAVALASVVVVPAALGDYWRADETLAAAAAIRVDDAPLAPVVPETVPTGTVRPAAPSPAASGDSDPAPSTTAPSTTTSTIAPLPDLARPVRIVLTGDSTAEALGAGVVSWAVAHPDLAQVEVVGAAGCGFVMGGERLFGEDLVSVETCSGWVETQLLPVVSATSPDVVAVMVTTWDVLGRRWDDGEVLTPLDGEYRERLDEAYGSLVESLLAAGAGRVAFVRQPVPDVWWSEEVHPEDEAVRHQVIYDVYDGLAADPAGPVAVVGLDRWFTSAGLDRDRAARPDGIHLDPAVAGDVVERYLGEELVRAALGMGVS